MTYKWGLVGPGNIARLFAQGLKTLDDAILHGVASRQLDKAERFAEQWQVRHAFGSYQDLYQDPDIDIVYIATPHNYHFEHARAALEAGKHVLCEKPFTLNAEQAKELINLADQKKCFLMEAMWNRFQPWYAEASQILSSGFLGDIYHLTADLSFAFPFDPNHRLFNPELAGGALLDLGVYPLSLASLFMGKPIRISSEMHICATGVDDQVSMLLTYPGGATAVLGCSSRYTSNHSTTLYGSKGYLELQGMIGRPERLLLQLQGEAARLIETPYESNAYQYEAQAVMDMLDQGRMEHPRMPLSETLQIMKTLDQVREQGGLRYPEEL